MDKIQPYSFEWFQMIPFCHIDKMFGTKLHENYMKNNLTKLEKSRMELDLEEVEHKFLQLETEEARELYKTKVLQS